MAAYGSSLVFITIGRGVTAFPCRERAFESIGGYTLTVVLSSSGRLHLLFQAAGSGISRLSNAYAFVFTSQAPISRRPSLFYGLVRILSRFSRSAFACH